VYRDTDDIYTVEKENPEYAFRAVDVFLIEAGEKGGFGLNIIAPPTICVLLFPVCLVITD